MSKLGDLIVRLRLQYDDYKKGLKRADADTKGFAGTLGKIKGVGLAVFGALSAGAAAFAREFASHTNTIGDAWAHTMSSMKASYHSVIADMSTYKPDFSSFRNFFKNEWNWIKNTLFNAKEAGDAAVEMSKAFDAEFELVNSVKLQRQQIQQELNELYIRMRDTTLPPEERKAAADRYKALLQPIADAEVAVYGNMVKTAVKAWQAGNELDREYSVAELTEFFSGIGTEYDKMQKKFPDLMRVYEQRKGDAQNQIIFDTLGKLQQAVNQMSEVDRILSRTTLSINKQLAGQGNVEFGLPTMTGITGSAVAMSEPGLAGGGWDAYFNEQMAAGEEFMAWYENMVDRTAMMSDMLADSMIQSTTVGIQAFTDMLYGLENANPSDMLAALLQPFAQTCTQLGTILIAESEAIKAFKQGLLTLDPKAPLIAGLALVALGSALGSAIKALGGSGSSSSAVNGGYNSGSAGSSQSYSPELTVRIQGKLRGSDIVMSEENTKDKWNR